MSEMSDSPNSNYAAKALIWLSCIAPILATLFLWVAQWENGILKNTAMPILGFAFFASLGIALKKIIKSASLKREFEYVVFGLSIISLVLLARVLQAIWPA